MVALVIIGLVLSDQVQGLGLLVFLTAMVWTFVGTLNVVSTATFDRQAGQFTLVQRRDGRLVAKRSEPLSAIETVVLQATSRSGLNDDILQTRPAVVIGGVSVPLTYASFISGPLPTDIAMALRRFLRLPETDLPDDSIRQALKVSPGTGPAVRLARICKGMGKIEAAQYVRKLDVRPGARRRPIHVIRRERS